MVLDLLIDHDRFGSSSDPILNGKLHWPNDIDKSLNESGTDKIRKYHTDYNNNPPNVISFIPAIASTSGRLHSGFIRILQTHRETDRFFAASGVQSRVSSIFTKATTLRINLNLDGVPITSKSHDHPSHSQTSHLLTSSLSLGVPVPRPTQCMRGA